MVFDSQQHKADSTSKIGYIDYDYSLHKCFVILSDIAGLLNVCVCARVREATNIGNRACNWKCKLMFPCAKKLGKQAGTDCTLT